MRPLLLALIFLGLATWPAAVCAQSTPAAAGPTFSLKDGVFRRNGKMMRLQAGEASRLSAPVTFDNGLVARPDGILISKDGTRQLLEEGKAVNRQGQIVSFADDMQTAAAIEQRAQKVTGQPTETRVLLPASSPATPAQTAGVQRLEKRLEVLQQATDRLADRANAAGAPPTAAPVDAQIRDVDAQLKPKKEGQP